MGGKGSGGRRRGAGRKPKPAEEKREPVTVWVLPGTRAYFEALGAVSEEMARVLDGVASGAGEPDPVPPSNPSNPPDSPDSTRKPD
jgi:hypothetical protein